MMIQISPADNSIMTLLGAQKVDINTKYRLLRYLNIIEIDNGYLIYNFLTKQMIFTENLECSNQFLVQNYFCVPVNFNEEKLLNNIRKTVKQLIKKEKLNYFKIMTTTDCNARCFYCFEKDLKRFDMTEQTAVDVADFIIQKCDKNIKISWFGGEPLYNEKAIDIISKRFLENNINFSADMITNGFLFCSYNIAKASNLWNLNHVQITLDGTERIYNKVKNYIYQDVNAYQRVLDNIEKLLSAGISVTARLNMDLYNADDLEKLIEILAKRFGNYKKFNCYIQPLFEGCGSHKELRTEDVRTLINNKYFQLYECAKNLGIYRQQVLDRKFKVYACVADSPNSIAVYPDGRLWKCDHYGEGEDIGNIYNDIYNKEKIASWTKLRHYEECGRCKFFPECIIPEKCLEVLPGCYESDRFVKTKILEDTMLQIYNIKNKK